MSTETPLVPRKHQYDVTIYIVLDQFRGVLGRAYRETDEGDADELTIIENFINGEYSRPVRVVAFNTHEGWSRDVTEEIALKLLDLSREGRVLGAAAREFVERVTGKAPTVISCRSGERLRLRAGQRQAWSGPSRSHDWNYLT